MKPSCHRAPPGPTLSESDGDRDALSDLVVSPHNTEEADNSGAIWFTRVDVDFSDPNIRGASGSVFHAGTDEDREDFLRWIESGMTNHDATQKLALRIARESQRVIEWFPGGSRSSST